MTTGYIQQQNSGNSLAISNAITLLSIAKYPYLHTSGYLANCHIDLLQSAILLFLDKVRVFDLVS